MVHHYEKPPFGEDFLSLFPSTEQANQKVYVSWPAKKTCSHWGDMAIHSEWNPNFNKPSRNPLVEDPQCESLSK